MPLYGANLTLITINNVLKVSGDLMKKSDSRSRLKWIIIIAMLIICSLVCIWVIFNNKDSDNESKNKYELLEYESNIYSNDIVGQSGDFIYINDFSTGFYGEYDTEKNSLIQLPINGTIANMNFCNGELYCLLYSNKKIDGVNLFVVKMDINTGDYDILYSVPDGVEGLYNFSMTGSGLMFFEERKPSSEVKVGENLTDDEGYNLNYTLYMYNPETKEKTEIAEGADRYFFYKDRVYFNKTSVKDSTEEIFYTDIEKTENVVDTGICCRSKDAVSNGYDGWFCIDNDYIYYSGGTESLYRYSLNDNNTEKVFTYDESKGYVGKIIPFGNKLILYVRCAFDNDVGFGAKLYEFDTQTKENTLVWTDTLEELLGDCVSFKGNDDFYYISTYPSYELLVDDESIGNRYYIVTADGTKERMYESINSVTRTE